jgi:hypothetical protein
MKTAEETNLCNNRTLNTDGALLLGGRLDAVAVVHCCLNSIADSSRWVQIFYKKA